MDLGILDLLFDRGPVSTNVEEVRSTSNPNPAPEELTDVDTSRQRPVADACRDEGDKKEFRGIEELQNERMD